MEFLLKPFTTIVFLLFCSSIFPLSSGKEDDEELKECNRQYECGDIRGLPFPFWKGDLPEYCGHPDFKVSCTIQNHSVFRINDLDYQILNISRSNQRNTIRVARLDLLGDPCSPIQSKHYVNSTLSYRYGLSFYFPQEVENLTLFYGCDTLWSNQESVGSFPYNFSCATQNLGTSSTSVFYANDSLLESVEPNHRPVSCEGIVQVPIFKETFDDERPSPGEEGKNEVRAALSKGFDVTYHDFAECGYNLSTSEIHCFCQPGSEHIQFCLPPAPTPRHGPNVTLKIIIGVSAAFAAVAVMSVIFFLYLWRRNRKQYVPSTMLFRNISSDVSSGKDVEKSTYLGVHVFSYEELVEATKNFDSAKELGDGGFGTVYYGELRDGRAVAVKRLYESNCRRVEQFMNEVEILAHLRHKNLVSLYGCTSRQSHELLLVYEYIPNGTVADHLHGERARPGALPWHIRLNIAIETACALSYLHASEIVHRDVKTNNILLDNNFSVKVADFGLSRLFPMHVTHVSTAPQGTPGYVDPEYHQCYQLTSKSDVFSFGVVLMELVSSMPAVDITRHRHDINLSTMAMNRIQNGTLHELVDPCLGFNSDSRVKKMITAVAELAFQCLQHEKDMRPPMVDVLEELKAIQSRDFETEKAEKNDSITDEAVLLNSGPLTLSPDTVTINWSSRNTTPNASG